MPEFSDSSKHKTLTPETSKPVSLKPLKIVLAGNPNVGKSIFFNFLTGAYVEVSNFPGTTVAISSGVYKNYSVFDTPGIYGVSSFNDEERVARDIILDADIILNVVNALHLERDLFLTRQLIDMGKKVSVLLNFADEVKKLNIKINAEKLSVELGVPVIETSAVHKKGFDRIDEAISIAAAGRQLKELLSVTEKFCSDKIPLPAALLIAEGDKATAEQYGVEPGTPDDREIIYVERRNTVNQIISEVEYEDSSKGRFFNRIGRISLNPYTGFPFLIVVLALLYFIIGDVVAQRVVNFTEKTIGKYYFDYYVKSFVGNYAAVDITLTFHNQNKTIDSVKTFSFPNASNYNPALKEQFTKESRLTNTETEFYFHNSFVRVFFGDFGIITMTVSYMIFLLLPLVIAFYIVMAFLEDSGYLPRLATLLDRTLNRIGLNGRAVIPLLLGFGCVTMATITTRILGTERERTIATAIMQFVIPCSAQLAVITVLIAGAGYIPLLIFITVIFALLILLSTVLSKLVKGTTSPLLIDLPIMRMPRLDNVLKKTVYRSIGFMKEAGLWFFAGAVFVGVLDITGLLIAFQDLLAPVTTMWLKLPKEAANAFVMGIVRRDFGAAGLFTLHLSPMQITVAIITITIFVPCIASAMVMIKERGWKEGVIVWGSTWITAFFIGGIVAQIIV